MCKASSVVTAPPSRSSFVQHSSEVFNNGPDQNQTVIPIRGLAMKEREEEKFCFSMASEGREEKQSKAAAAGRRS